MATKPQDGNLQVLLATHVDELGALEDELRKVKAKIARAELLRRVLREHFDNADASQTFEIRGERFAAVVGARGNERRVDPAALIAVIGLKKYAALTVPTLRSLEGAVAPAVLAKVVTEDQTGTRSLRIFELGRAA